MRRPKLTLIIAEAALELVPKELWEHPSVKSYALRRKKKPSNVLLDRSYHHSAMMKLRYASKRGRPDIVHFVMLEALGSPLNKVGLLELYIHTVNDRVIYVDPSVRLPRNYNRFLGLMENLLSFGRVPPAGKALMWVKEKGIKELVLEAKPTYAVTFSSKGKPTMLSEVAKRLAKQQFPMVIIGGFPRGEFSEKVVKLADDVVSIDPEPLDAWIVTSRVVYEYEKAINLPEKRFRG